MVNFEKKPNFQNLNATLTETRSPFIDKVKSPLKEKKRSYDAYLEKENTILKELNEEKIKNLEISNRFQRKVKEYVIHNFFIMLTRQLYLFRRTKYMIRKLRRMTCRKITRQN